MDRRIFKKLKDFDRNIKYYETKVDDKDQFFINLTEKIKEYTKMYFEADNEDAKQQILNVLNEYYDLLQYINSKKNLRRMFIYPDDIEDLPTVFILDQKPVRFDVDDSLLNDMDIEHGLTEEQAQELLKTIVNNTRDNLNKSSSNPNNDVYENDSLGGACGFSQFSTLYPLQQLGLHITVNNMRALSDCSHDYGTVVIPINKDGKKFYKRYLIDCTYRQFFMLTYNLLSRYIKSHPEPGFFVVLDSEEISFATELLKNGFMEATPRNLKLYFKPFYSVNYKIEDTHRIDKDFSKVDIIDILENKQTDFDYTEEEFLKWGLKVSVNNNSISL